MGSFVNPIRETCNDCFRGWRSRYDPLTKEKVSHELADIILRVLGLAGSLNLDMETEIANKMKINIERGAEYRIKKGRLK